MLPQMNEAEGKTAMDIFWERLAHDNVGNLYAKGSSCHTELLSDANPSL